MTNQQTLARLQLAANRQDSFRQSVLNANAAAVRQQNISRILDEINTMANPQPAPEPTVVYVEQPNEDELRDMERLRRTWFQR